MILITHGYDDTQSTEFSGNDSLFVANIMPMYFNGLKEGFY